ncbi:MAG TPA: hypothetical protein PK018_16170, partial [Candidatus Competibacter sp.]|nr:hypothetical protein [Candidatus Competibacter sp.]
NADTWILNPVAGVIRCRHGPNRQAPSKRTFSRPKLKPPELDLPQRSPARWTAITGNRPAGSSLIACSIPTPRYKSEKLTPFGQRVKKMTMDSARIPGFFGFVTVGNRRFP